MSKQTAQTFNEKDIKLASDLLKQRKMMSKAVKSETVNELKCTEDWHVGSAVLPYRKRMVEARLLCMRISTTVMRDTAERAIADIDKELEKLGVTPGDDD